MSLLVIPVPSLAPTARRLNVLAPLGGRAVRGGRHVPACYPSLSPALTNPMADCPIALGGVRWGEEDNETGLLVLRGMMLIKNYIYLILSCYTVV